MGEFVEGFDTLADVFDGCAFSARPHPAHRSALCQRVETARLLAEEKLSHHHRGRPRYHGGGQQGSGGRRCLSIGCNIELPFEQGTNKYVKRSINFKFFFVRKTMFASTPWPFVVFPGGFGTMDELSKR